MSLDSEIPFYAGNYEETLLTENNTTISSATTSGGMDFGVAIVNPSLNSGSSSNGSSSTASTIVYGPETYIEERNWVVVGVLIALIVMLWVILGGMICYPLLRFIRRRWPVSKRRINRRYETIEGWLITKIVRPHDEGCNQIQKKVSSKQDRQESTTTAPATITATSCLTGRDYLENQEEQATNNSPMKHAESYDTAETAVDDCLFDSCGDCDRECPICMDAFAVGDIVSWSSYERCSHVYHHQCIKEWLLRHNNCPFCREIFLPVDKAHTKITKDIFRELSDLRARRAEKTYYCVQDGLVTLHGKNKRCDKTSTDAPTTSAPSSILRKQQCGHIIKRHSNTQIIADIKEKLKSGVTKADLKKLRGDRAEKICYGDTEDSYLNTVIQDQELLNEDDDIESQQQHETQSSTPDNTDHTVMETMVRNDSLTSESSDEIGIDGLIEEGGADNSSSSSPFSIANRVENDNKAPAVQQADRGVEDSVGQTEVAIELEWKNVTRRKRLDHYSKGDQVDHTEE